MTTYYDLVWDVADMIADTFGRSVIEADKKLAAQIIDHVRANATAPCTTCQPGCRVSSRR